MQVLRFLDKHAEKLLAVWLYCYIVLVIFFEVLRRYSISFSSLWGEETARYAFIYMAWLGASIAVKERLHIRIGLLSDHLGSRGQNAIMIFSGICGLFFSAFAVWYSMAPFLTSLEFGSVTQGLRISQAWFLFSVPLGFTLIFVRFLQNLVEDVHQFRMGLPPIVPTKLFA